MIPGFRACSLGANMVRDCALGVVLDEKGFEKKKNKAAETWEAKLGKGFPATARGAGRSSANQVARHVRGKGGCPFPAGSTRRPGFAGSAHFLGGSP